MFQMLPLASGIHGNSSEFNATATNCGVSLRAVSSAKLLFKRVPMPVVPTTTDNSFRMEVRYWLQSNMPKAFPSPDTRAGFGRHVDWERLMQRSGWNAVAWPTEFGGRGEGLREWVIFEEEYLLADGPERVTGEGIGLVAPKVFKFGNVKQKREILSSILAGSAMWCTGVPGPDAGGNPSSATPVAEQIEGGWLVNGSGTWTRRGAFCTHVELLARSEPDSTGLDGLTVLLMPLNLPGVVVFPVSSTATDDEAFAWVKFTNTFLPHSAVPGGVVLGDPSNGASVRADPGPWTFGPTLRVPVYFTNALQRLTELYTSTHPEGDAYVRDRLARVAIRVEAYRLYVDALVRDVLAGNATAPIETRWLDELDIEIHDIALSLLADRPELYATWSPGWHRAMQRMTSFTEPFKTGPWSKRTAAFPMRVS